MSQTEAEHNEIGAALRRLRGSAISIGAFSAAINLLFLVPSLYMLQVYDRAIPSGNGFTLLMLTVIAMLLLALMGGLEYARSRVVIHAGSRLDDLLGRRVHQAAFERGLAGGQAQAGQATRDLDALRQFLTGNAIFAFFDAPWCPLFLIVMFLFHPLVGALALAGGLLLTALAWLNERVSRKPLTEAGGLSIRAAQGVEGQLRNAEAIEAMGMLDRLYRLWSVPHRGYVRRQATASDRSAAIGSLSKTLRVALQSMVLGLGAWLVLHSRISPGMMTAGSILMGRVLSPVDQVIVAWRQWTNTRLAHDRLKTLLANHPSRPTPLPLPAPTGALRFESVSSFPPGSRTKAPTVVGLDFALPAGELLGVVGPSGSGKSTLARLMVGVWHPRAGTVRLDDADIRQWDRDRLGPHVGYLPQDVELFAGTVAENISRFAEADADPAMVVAAAQLAGAHELILGLSNGYDTMLGGAGLGLSGGQRQRVALARALYGQPKLVVLDEPNANLDEAGEKSLLDCLLRLRADAVTTVVITHRPKVLEAVTLLMAMRDGRIQLYGPTSDVIARMREASMRPAARPTVAPVTPANASMGGRFAGA